MKEVIIVYGLDDLLDEIRLNLLGKRPKYKARFYFFSTPEEAWKAVLETEFLASGLLLIGYQFPRRQRSAEDLLKRVPMDKKRIVRVSLTPRTEAELGGLICIKPEVDEVRRVIAEFLQ